MQDACEDVPEGVPAVEGEESPAAQPAAELDADAFEDAPAQETPVAEEVSLAPAPAEPPPPPVVVYAASPQTSGMAIASLVMGIVGWTLLPLVGSILAIVFGYVARRDIRSRPDELTGEGMAMAGLVLGWLMVALSVSCICILIVLLVVPVVLGPSMGNVFSTVIETVEAMTPMP